jgi:hypothetical protein
MTRLRAVLAPHLTDKLHTRGGPIVMAASFELAASREYALYAAAPGILYASIVRDPS